MDVGSKQAWDKAERDLDSARARRALAAAEVQRLTALVEKTVISAAIDGVVIARHAHAGETIAPGEAIVTVADLGKMRIEAEVDEIDSARVHLGAPVQISAEGFDRAWRAANEEIPEAVVNGRINPQDRPSPSTPACCS